MTNWIEQNKSSEIDDMKAMTDDLSIIKPWFDDPKTHELATKCMMFASFVGVLRASGNLSAEAAASTMLKKLSETSKIPYHVLSTYADGVAALNAHAGHEILMTDTGKQ